MGLPPSQIKRRHMPTKLQVEDRFELGSWFSFTLRQGGIVLAGLVAGYLVWKALAGWLAFLEPAGLSWVPIVPAGAVILLFIAVALFKIQDRYPEQWLVIWLSYQQFPKVYLWQPVGPAREREQNARRRSSQQKPPLEAANTDPDEEGHTI